MAFRTPKSEGRSELDENAVLPGIAKLKNHVAPGFRGIVKSADLVEAGIQKSYRHAEVVIDPPDGGIVKSSYFLTFGMCKSYEHLEVDIDSPLLGTVRFFELAYCRAAVSVNTSLKQLVNSSGAGGMVLDEYGGSRLFVVNLMLPVGTAICLEAPLSSADSVTEEDKLPTQSELKAVIPALAIAAGSFGAVSAGVNGGLQMIGFTAVIIFLVHDLLWSSNRWLLWEDLIKVTEREKLVSFLKSRNIIKTDESV